MSAESHPASASTPLNLPKSDVSSGVGLAGLLGLMLWILFCRTFPVIVETLGLGSGYGVLSGPYAALTAMAFTAGPMAIWSLLVDKVHLRASTGLDWSIRRSVEDVLPVSTVKIVGLWATWAIIAALYCLCRWYWDGSYLFAMEVLGFLIVPMVVLSVPYIIWLDRFMTDQRDSTWHFGAALLGREGVDLDQVKKHWRAWIIKAFFGAFMISILPPGFAFIVEADPAAIIANPFEFGMLLITLLFVVDVQIGTVGYLFTLRPLDAHIRSGNPFVAGWLAALLCYPPFVWGIIGNNGQILSYEGATAGWGHWMAGQPALLWVWAAWLVFLTAIYAWATVVFGIRFSNLTYRGVLTNGPYRFTRHPAYLSKNLFWWCSVMPFLVTNGSAVDAIRNTFFLAVVNAIYYWRARTEEAHLLAEDPKYREYYDWMEVNGLVTAPLARLKLKLIGRISGGKRASGKPEAGLQEPAE
ncbi:putative membrane protein [Erythrobacter sp. NAP1]|uniref:methyltransferase family protein n=1 Tax=Erythrobacter sp. NAP1 TaxID=237727 RepID=UPI0000686F54|nr:isoprenylcysteine carboxylmethyltransferase family protein [Erythrobacter sp. NAP1]EAQ29546.1 putative membrane protein [Erythrobacter sp. NAP1]